MYSIASSRKHPVMVSRQPMQMTTAEANKPCASNASGTLKQHTPALELLEDHEFCVMQ